ARVATTARINVRDEVVGIAECGEAWRSCRVGVNHVQRLFTNGVHHLEEHRCRAAADVRVDRLQRRNIPLELAQRWIGPIWLAVYPKGRGGIAVNRKYRIICGKLGLDVVVDLADLVRG